MSYSGQHEYDTAQGSPFMLRQSLGNFYWSWRWMKLETQMFYVVTSSVGCVQPQLLTPDLSGGVLYSWELE